MKFASVLFVLLSVTSAIADPTLRDKPSVILATMCFKSGEQESGMNKICYYDCLGSAYAITISNVQLCPLTIEN